jgi:hypothetical protein
MTTDVVSSNPVHAEVYSILHYVGSSSILQPEETGVPRENHDLSQVTDKFIT